MRGSKFKGGAGFRSGYNQEAEVGEVWQVLRIVLSVWSASLSGTTLGKDES